MSENVRGEVASHGVRVMTIAPGVVETELLGHTTSDAIKDGYNEWKQRLTVDSIRKSSRTPSYSPSSNRNM